MMEAKVFRDILRTVGEGGSADLTIHHQQNELIRRFLSNDRLIILGGGHVGLALCRMAALLDFSITVVDDRPSFANSERFPQAEKVICDSFENAVRELDIRGKDYVCVLTRGHRWDRLCVETVLSGTMPFYLGMIGSHKRVAGLKEILYENGFARERIDLLHAPIGLSIGAQTPAEIALSICAEMIRIKRQNHLTEEDNVLFSTNTDFEMLRFLANAEAPRAMLLVLSSDGSTPVDSGAMMAVDALGNACGTIGGGCGEAAALAKARRIIGTGKSAVLDIDMNNDIAADNGMVCGGSMTVWIEDIVF